jgi:hypothetical protein
MKWLLSLESTAHLHSISNNRSDLRSSMTSASTAGFSTCGRKTVGQEILERLAPIARLARSILTPRIRSGASNSCLTGVEESICKRDIDLALRRPAKWSVQATCAVLLT